MEKDQCKPGGTVRLKSGGPQMTIAEVGEYLSEYKAKCHWFDGNKLCEDLFSPAELDPD